MGSHMSPATSKMCSGKEQTWRALAATDVGSWRDATMVALSCGTMKAEDEIDPTNSHRIERQNLPRALTHMQKLGTSRLAHVQQQ